MENQPCNIASMAKVTKYYNPRLNRYEYTLEENGQIRSLTYEDGYKKGYEDAFHAIFGYRNWYRQEYEEVGKPDDEREMPLL